MHRFVTSVFALALAGSVAMAEEPKAAAGQGSQDLFAIISTTKGDIWVLLYPDKAPVTVAGFVNLAQRGFYDGVKFHRVIPEFMIQGGDPKGNGTGDPGYKFKDEFSPDLRHDFYGVLSMANSGPGTNGSQFFITHKETPHLNDKHSIFGQVIDGQDVVDAIVKDDAMNVMVIEGDTTALFNANKDQIAQWNTTLDAKFPAKESPARAAKQAEVKGKVAEMKSKAAAVKAMTPDARMKAVAERTAARMQKAAAAKAAAQAAQAAALPDKIKQIEAETGSKVVTTPSGLMYADIKVGDGASPTPTSQVEVHYTGWLLDGKKFDSSYDRNEAYSPRLDGLIIKGWKEGIVSMKVGGKRKLIVPPDLAYGAQGHPAGIPGGATLIFEIELLSIK